MRHRLRTSLLQVRYSLLPPLAAQRVVGEPLNLLGQAVRVLPLQNFHDPGVQGAAALTEQAAISNLVREGVLEGVLQVRIQVRLVQELRRLEAGQRRPQRGLW